MFGNKSGKDSSSGAITGNARDTAENTGADAINAGKALHTSTSVRNSEWIIDSGATNHMTFNDNIQTIQPSNHHVVFTANGTPSSVSGEGTENDEVQIATKPTDNVDIIAHGNQLIDTLDSLETNEECPVNENTEEHQDREEYTSENGPEIVDGNQDTLEGADSFPQCTS
uniref:Retrovirus-related Pol polyprotein from transposon TNT 1-94-like beta-barrel domain-containing protein n=1 Tax=Populus alba TaxID=43335 RepID=A0A4U5Q4R6_POPAL|nr:hypothetical protein D5086_0000141210 [Populus alba]